LAVALLVRERGEGSLYPAVAARLKSPIASLRVESPAGVLYPD
jgi:hypothetical protein